MNAIALLSLVAATMAALPPDTCDATAIQKCLDDFVTVFEQCGSDLHCQCTSVTTHGASCYAACPQNARTTFIETYSDGLCKTFDPYLSKRDENDTNSEDQSSEVDNSEAEIDPDSDLTEYIAIGSEFDSVIVKAITVTPSDPTTTISLSPQEFKSKLELSRYKENLRSIRSERARISREAELVRSPDRGVNKQESPLVTETSSVYTAKASPESTKTKQVKETGDKMSNKASKAITGAPFAVLVTLALL